MSLLVEMRERIRALVFWNHEEDAMDGRSPLPPLLDPPLYDFITR